MCGCESGKRMGIYQSQARQRARPPPSCWDSLPLETRLLLANLLREAVPCAGTEEAQCVLLVCEPSAEVVAYLSKQAVLQEKGLLPDKCAPPNVMAVESCGTEKHVDAYKAMVEVEGAILAILHPYMQRDDRSGVSYIPGIFVLPKNATVGELKAWIRCRYRLGHHAVFSVFFEESKEKGYQASLVLPLDNVTLAKACMYVHDDGFVRGSVVMEDM